MQLYFYKLMLMEYYYYLYVYEHVFKKMGLFNYSLAFNIRMQVTHKNKLSYFSQLNEIVTRCILMFPSDGLHLTHSLTKRFVLNADNWK